MHRRPALGLTALISALAAHARAIEPGELAGEPVRLDVTEGSSFLYNADNRNTRAASVESRTDDDWSLWYNRLNLQAAWGRFQAGVRLDSALFVTSPDPAEIGLELLELRRGSREPPFSDDDARFFVDKTLEAGTDLSNRYINWVYPAKYYVGYTTADVEATLGDFNAQLGRGLVLSVRKLDELSSDTTLRGARVTGRLRAGDVRLKLTGLGGVGNPLRIDEASGRYLAVDESVTPGLVAISEAGMPRTVETDFVPDPRPSLAPDRLAGAQIEGGTRHALVGLQGVLLDREPALTHDVVRTADSTIAGSLSLNLPDLDDHGTAYVEAALQELSHSQAPQTDLTGHALYAAVTFIERPLTLTAEAKHYRRFFPLTANVDVGLAREFAIVQYSAPPTTEAFWVDTEFEGFNTCVSGGRAKTDVAVGADASVFVWVGRYHTWAESVTNEACEVSDSNLNRVWDIATGLEITSQRRRSRATGTIGARIDETDREIVDGRGFATHRFYQESYARYDVIRFIGGPWSLQLQGWHRRRLQSFGGPLDRYYQGQHLTGLTYAEFNAAVGFEYDTDPQTPDIYLNGQLGYELGAGSSLSLFVGQRRGGLRCVGGVCRIFPPFEGARLDLTVRL
jgi:hypothetical protein